MSENGKVRVFWATPERDMRGNALGYSYQNSMLKKYASPYIIEDPSADMILQMVSAEFYTHVIGKINILSTMWEFVDVPESYKKALALADYVIVPSSFCRDIFKPYTKRIPYVCHNGVEPQIYTYKQRELNNGQRFRYLWCGASNVRKGYPFLIEATKLCDKFPQMEIYLKTTMVRVTFKSMLRSIRMYWKDIIRDKDTKRFHSMLRILRRIPSPFNSEKIFVYGKNKNVVVDNRKLPIEELVALYHSAHCFLFPSLGEGWGLTLCEAMATGLPCVSVNHSGCADFFDEDVGYVLKTEIQENDLENYKVRKCRMSVPLVQDFFNKMLLVPQEYDHALQKAKRASDRIRNKFTWEQSGHRFAEILKDIAMRE